MSKAVSEKALMNRLYNDFGLSPDHVFTHQHYKIITRAGIDLIQAKAKIKVRYIVEPALCNIAEGIVCVKAEGVNEAGEIIETFGEASPTNNRNAYPVAMAEKRAMARAVLKLAGLYQEGVFSEDEAEDFKASVRTARAIQ